MKILIVYLAVISPVTAVVTIYDKLAAKRDAWRIPEKTLLLLAVAGGAVAEYFVMLAIRHKTKHNKFMVGLPAILILQLVAVAAVLFLMYQKTAIG